MDSSHVVHMTNIIYHSSIEIVFKDMVAYVSALGLVYNFAGPYVGQQLNYKQIRKYTEETLNNNCVF